MHPTWPHANLATCAQRTCRFTCEWQTRINRDASQNPTPRMKGTDQIPIVCGSPVYAPTSKRVTFHIIEIPGARQRREAWQLCDVTRASSYVVLPRGGLEDRSDLRRSARFFYATALLTLAPSSASETPSLRRSADSAPPPPRAPPSSPPSRAPRTPRSHIPSMLRFIQRP